MKLVTLRLVFVMTLVILARSDKTTFNSVNLNKCGLLLSETGGSSVFAFIEAVRFWGARRSEVELTGILWRRHVQCRSARLVSSNLRGPVALEVNTVRKCSL